MRTGLSAAVTGTLASLATTAALGALARMEGKGAVQPINATSHWLHGEAAADEDEVDLAHTGVGYATHHASAIFWALPLHLVLARWKPDTVTKTLGAAAATAGVAALVDYLMLPKRLTPGWEEAVSKRSVAATFAVMGLALAAGALINRPRPRPDPPLLPPPR